MTAKADGVFSNNTASSRVTVSESDPKIREGVKVVGYFVPTSLVTINLGDASEGVEHTLRFSGPIAPEALSLQVGDYVTGLTSEEFKPFIRKILMITEKSQNGVTMKVVSAPLEEIFESLDIDGGFEVSRKGGEEAIEGRRRLFLGSLFDKAKSFVGDVFNGIGDAVTKTVKDVGKFLEETFLWRKTVRVFSS